MSSRAVYTFKDDNYIVHVYKHFDGYPSGAAIFLNAALPLAWELPRFEADEFAAAFVAANKGKKGGNIRLVGTDATSNGMMLQPWEFAADAEYWYGLELVPTLRAEKAGKDIVLQKTGDFHLQVTAYSVNWWDACEGGHSETVLYQGPLEGFAEWAEEWDAV